MWHPLDIGARAQLVEDISVTSVCRQACESPYTESCGRMRYLTVGNTRKHGRQYTHVCCASLGQIAGATPRTQLSAVAEVGITMYTKAVMPDG